MLKPLRILKHRWLDESDVRRALPDAALKRLEAARARQRDGATAARSASASRPACRCPTSGATRRRASARWTMFGKLRVWDTEHNNGVLIYLLLAEHAIEIVADRGLDRHVPDTEWKAVVDAMAAEFRAGRFEDGLNRAIDAVDALLVHHFPLGDGRRRRTSCRTASTSP